MTGAGSGLGRELALQLARKGGRVLCCDIDAATAGATADAVRAAGGEALFQRCDVGQSEEVEALAARCEAEWGGVDLLINNAGVAVAGEVGVTSLEDWSWVVQVNLWGVIYGCHTFAPRMRAQGRGYILNVASAAGLLTPPTLGPYNVTKAGVVALSETLHGEAGPDGVRVTVLCPTFFRTNLMDTSRGGNEKMQGFVAKAMDRSKVQAPEVAAAGLQALERGELYALPMRDARAFWRLKRLAPGRFPKLVEGVRRLRVKKA